ncbi:uncharacterized protein CELE_W06D11.3 [Caenorhabditis elegans]|uniref:Uncharacterized protein n=1 Tax=Caenorhabditis elegans TaxID=6239 RepID=Q23198_CAEEL|nr:Uncharacterized protein CELE_W06D11.3 [Caenorhabditis elegans]CAA93536.1 Uncharacterized protein CELE_W06D11.3 [Caenorhabditis elegans]|eukprot:NP_510054.1 Uncharacterized protein CELE_W06D11.3 [Caenorhabditis elegans]
MVYGLLEDFHGEKPSRIFRLGTKKEKKFQKKDTLRQEVLNSHFLDNLHIYVVRERKLRREERQKRRESKDSSKQHMVTENIETVDAENEQQDGEKIASNTGDAPNITHLVDTSSSDIAGTTDSNNNNDKKTEELPEEKI